MNYMLLIYENAEAFAARTDPARGAAMMGAWYAYSTALAEAGVMVSGAGLAPPSTATTVTMNDGRATIHDGPFADIKEQLGGFYIIDVTDLDKAIEWASRAPALPGTKLELRTTLMPPQL